MKQMTAEEAIKWISEHFPPDDETQQSNAIRTALFALEKQVGKEPKWEIEPYQKHMTPGVKAPYCPECGCDLLDEYNDCFEYCPDCGIHIIWPDQDGQKGEGEEWTETD